MKLLLLRGAFGLSDRQLPAGREPAPDACAGRRPSGALAWPASAAAVLAGRRSMVSGSIDKTAKRLEAAAAAVQPARSSTRPRRRARRARRPEAPLPPVVAAVRAAEDGGADPVAADAAGRQAPRRLLPLPERLHAARRARRGAGSAGSATPSSSKTIVVIGDSHAQMWMPTILDMAQRDSWVVHPVRQGRAASRARGSTPGRRVQHVVPLGEAARDGAAAGRDA